MLTSIREDISDARDEIHEIKNGQQRVVWWVASALSSFVVGGVLGWVFQK
jgi:hypothetical protein